MCRCGSITSSYFDGWLWNLAAAISLKLTVKDLVFLFQYLSKIIVADYVCVDSFDLESGICMVLRQCMFLGELISTQCIVEQLWKLFNCDERTLFLFF